MEKPKIFPQMVASMLATLAASSTGYHCGWPSPALAKLQSEDSDILITSSQSSWIVGFLLIGCIFGSFFGFGLVDRWGRKKSLLLTSIPLTLSCVLIAVGTSYWWFYLARFIAGIGVGMSCSISLMYSSEIVEDRFRGGLGTLNAFMVNVVSLVPYTIGPWTSRATLALAGIVIPVLFAVTFVWVPESPYYYAMKNVPHKIKKSLTWLRGTSDVDEEVKKIQANVALNRNQTGTISELFTMKGNRKAVIIMLGLFASNHLSGLPVIETYSTIIFDGINSGIDSSVSVIIFGIIKTVTVIPVVFLIDRVGRRPFLLASMTFCGIFLLAEAIYFHLQANGTDVTTFAWFPLLAISGHLISYSMGILPLSPIIPSEIFPCEVKAFAMAVGMVSFSAFGTCVVKFYQIVTDAYGIHVAFYSFAACSFGCTGFIFFLVPETKNRPLGDIQDELRGLSKPML